MALSQQPVREAYRCPDCRGTIAFENGVWGCTNCSYVPRHSAD